MRGIVDKGEIDVATLNISLSGFSLIYMDVQDREWKDDIHETRHKTSTHLIDKR